MSGNTVERPKNIVRPKSMAAQHLGTRAANNSRQLQIAARKTNLS